MSEVEALNPTPEDIDLVKKNLKNSGILHIRGNGTPSTLEVYIRQPVLADIIEKMTPGNYHYAQYDPIFHPILIRLPKKEELVVTRPAIYIATTNFAKATVLDFSTLPPGILLCNHEKLREGFVLSVNLKAPVPNDTLRKWGKHFNDGVNDIISASKPFKMEWILRESKPGGQ